MLRYVSNIVAVVNLGGYTKGARNDIFAARPCPVQMQCMGYAGTLSAGGFQGRMHCSSPLTNCD